MLSWIFRHRQRLGVIYGMAPIPALPGARLQAAPTGGPMAIAEGEDPVRPGALRRRGRVIELRPMPRRVK